MTQMLRFKAKITPNKTATKTAKKKCFLVFSTKSGKKCDSTKPYNKSLINLVCSVCTGSIAFGFYRTDLAPSSLGLYENLRQYFPVQTSHSVNKFLIFSIISVNKSIDYNRRKLFQTNTAARRDYRSLCLYFCKNLQIYKAFLS